jgi:hypothetical protein
MIALDWNPSARTLRQFAAVAFLFLTGAAALAHERGGGWPAQVLLLGLGIAVGCVGSLRPAALRLPYLLLSLAVYPAGLVVSHLVLLVLFYGVITPLGALGRIVRPDPLELRRRGSGHSYWRARRRPLDKSSYLRQA